MWRRRRRGHKGHRGPAAAAAVPRSLHSLPPPPPPVVIINTGEMKVGLGSEGQQEACSVLPFSPRMNAAKNFWSTVHFHCQGLRHCSKKLFSSVNSLFMSYLLGFGCIWLILWWWWHIMSQMKSFAVAHLQKCDILKEQAITFYVHVE